MPLLGSTGDATRTYHLRRDPSPLLPPIATVIALALAPAACDKAPTSGDFAGAYTASFIAFADHHTGQDLVGLINLWLDFPTTPA